MAKRLEAESLIAHWAVPNKAEAIALLSPSFFLDSTGTKQTKANRNKRKTDEQTTQISVCGIGCAAFREEGEEEIWLPLLCRALMGLSDWNSALHRLVLSLSSSSSSLAALAVWSLWERWNKCVFLLVFCVSFVCFSALEFLLWPLMLVSSASSLYGPCKLEIEKIWRPRFRLSKN